MDSSDDSDICDFTTNFDDFIKKRMKKKFCDNPINLPSDDDDEPEIINCKSEESSTTTNSVTSSDSNIEEIVLSTNEESEENAEDTYANALDKLTELENLADDIACGRRINTKKRKRQTKEVPPPPVTAGRVTRSSQRIKNYQQLTIPFLMSSIPQPPLAVPLMDSNPTVDDNGVIEITDTEEKIEKLTFNNSVTVTVDWQLRKKLFDVKEFENLKTILDYFCKEHKVKPTLLLFTINNKEINLANNCYVSLNLNEDSVIEAVLLPESASDRPLLNDLSPFIGNLFKIKVQYVNQKQDLFVYLETSQTKLGIAYWQLMQHFQVDFENVKCYFDGVFIKPSDTPDLLDLEDGDCIDVVLEH